MVEKKDLPILLQIFKNQDELPEKVVFPINQKVYSTTKHTIKYALSYTPTKSILPTGELLFKILKEDIDSRLSLPEAIPESIDSSQIFYVIRTDLNELYLC